MKERITGFSEILRKKRLTTVAGAWVFYFLTSVIPIVFLAITAFGVFGVNFSMEFVSRLPDELRPAGEAIISTAENASKGATALFIFTVFFSSSALLNQMSKDGDFILGNGKKHKRGVLRRLWAITAMISIFLVFLGVAFLTAFGNTLINKKYFSGKREMFLTLMIFTAVIVFGYFIIIMLNRFISPVKLKFKVNAIGSLCSLFIIVLGTIGFVLYLRFFNSYNAFYGSLATIIVFLLWAYILMVGLVFGTIVNACILDGKPIGAKSQKNTKNIQAIC